MKPGEIEFSFDGYQGMKPENENSAIAAVVHRVSDNNSLKECGQKAGVSEATIYNWKHTDWWDDLKDEVWGELIGGDVKREALKYLRESLDENPKNQRWALERLSDEMKPPKQRVQHEEDDDDQSNPFHEVYDALYTDEVEVLKAIFALYTRETKARKNGAIQIAPWIAPLS